ncbi:MAG: GntR family transcriptional regulator [Actinomycetota bacterium]|nr:GntR family transcriptional regulator [Actinomycetota bacterium]
MARALRYADLADDLRRRIASGELRPGRLLPSEAQLAGDHHVSRVTVRKALAQLRDAGLVASRQGFGWYVTPTPVPQPLDGLRTIEANVLAAGQAPQRRVLGFGFVDAPARAREVLGVDTVLEIRRVNLADDEAFARVTVWVPEALATDLSRAAVERQSLYELLPTTLGGASQVISAVPAAPDDATLLDLPVGTPLLRAERTTRDVAGDAVLLSEAVFNPMLTELVVDLPPTGEAEPTGLRLVR